MIDLNDKAQPIIKGKDGPYIVVLLQEAGRMNVLTGQIARSLDELRRGSWASSTCRRRWRTC